MIFKNQAAIFLVYSSLCIFLGGCAPGSSPLLPTATLIPTQPVSTNTPTPLPPSTVTPYPTITPQGDVSQLDEVVAAGNGEGVAPTGGSSGSAQSDTPIPTVRVSAGSAQGDVPSSLNLGSPIFTADFTQGWPSVDDSTAKISIINGQYTFTIGPFDGRFFNTSTVDQGDLYAQVDVQILECSEGGVYGLLFRQSDAGNYYAFILFCNNTYSVIARVNGSLISSPIVAGNLSGSDASGVHSLGVLAEGNNLTFYVDGQQLASASDQRQTRGDVAMYAASQSTNVMQVAFDNLKVWSLP